MLKLAHSTKMRILHKNKLAAGVIREFTRQKSEAFWPLTDDRLQLV